MHARFSILIGFMSVALGGCVADEGSFEFEQEAEEEEPVEPVDSAVPDTKAASDQKSDVNCNPQKYTAYVKGVAKPIFVITIGGKRVAKPAGHAFLKMKSAADAAGVSLSIISGFRTMEEQRYLYRCYQTGSCNNGNLAARPGYSNHQSGIALDLKTSSWLAKNAGQFGFVRTVPSEAWHYEHRGPDPGGICDEN